MGLLRIHHYMGTFHIYQIPSRNKKFELGGAMYDVVGENVYDTATLEKQIRDLMEDDEIMKKSGIYRYLLSGNLYASVSEFSTKTERRSL